MAGSGPEGSPPPNKKATATIGAEILTPARRRFPPAALRFRITENNGVYRMTIDQKIWQPPAGGHRSEEEWAEIAEHLVQTLGEYLNQRVELVTMSILDGDALCCSIRSVVYFG